MSMQQFDLSTACANPSCNHQPDNHIKSEDGIVICNGDISCKCEGFIPHVLRNFALEVEMQKEKLVKLSERVKYILEKIPPTRNASDKNFAKIYWEIWHGFKIRKLVPQKLDTETWKRLPESDRINRAKRKVKQYNPELETYDVTMRKHQEALFQAVSEWSIEQ